MSEAADYRPLHFPLVSYNHCTPLYAVLREADAYRMLRQNRYAQRS